MKPGMISWSEALQNNKGQRDDGKNEMAQGAGGL